MVAQRNVDDGSGGANLIESCRKLAKDLKAAMLEGGFKLGKLKFLHTALRGDNEEEEQDKEASILGISWNTKTDHLSVAIDEEEFLERARTPHQIVKQQASL